MGRRVDDRAALIAIEIASMGVPSRERTRASTYTAQHVLPGMMEREERGMGDEFELEEDEEEGENMLLSTSLVSSDESSSPPLLLYDGLATGEHSTEQMSLPKSGRSRSGEAISALTPTMTLVAPSRTRAEPFA